MDINIAAIVLAAGAGSRFNGTKQLALVDGRPLVRCVVDACLGCAAHPVVVAVGYRAEQVAEVLPPDVIPLPVPEWQQGMGHSLAYAVKQLPDSVTHTMVVLADQGALTHGDLSLLLAAAEGAPQQIVAASYNNTSGVPAVFPRRFFAELQTFTGDRGARQLLRANAEAVLSVPMPGAAMDVDTLADLQRLTAVLDDSC
ncbi:nucleotidyltransferase family protein [Porticoccus sp. GXU_MW_L64]